MTPTELKEIFQSAAEAANVVPADLQPVAFAKAVELLLNSAPQANSHQLREDASIERANGGKARFSSNRPGPKAALDVLLRERYFETRRTQGEIQGFLKDAKGHEYSQNELSISLLRAVRKGMLTREKDNVGHYLYQAAKA